MNNKYDILIIGGGIAGLAMAHEISLNLLGQKNLKIGLIESNQLQKCSTRTTSIVSLHGIKKGISPLGDDLVDSYQLFESFVHGNSFRSIEKAKRFHFALSELEAEKIEKRFDKKHEFVFQKKNFRGHEEDTYIIESNVLLEEMKNICKEKGIEFLTDTILNVDDESRRNEKQILIKGQHDEYISSLVLVATGAYSNLMPLFKAKKEFYGTVIPGHYYEWDYSDYFDCKENESFVLTIEGHNLIYRKFDDKLILGGSTEKDGIAYTSHEQLKKQYEKFEEVLKMPKISEAKIYTGLRQKGVKRRPFIGELSPNVFAVSALYKNGFTLSFLGAKKALDFINTHLESY